MNNLIGIGDFVTPKRDGIWYECCGWGNQVKTGPRMGQVLRVVRASDVNGHIYIGFDEFPLDFYDNEEFRKVLPQGLSAWLSEVNMNPSKEKELA
jgi:hypothetical protein